MSVDKLLCELSQINTIVEEWRSSTVNEIEKDIVLEKLRDLYVGVKSISVSHLETVNDIRVDRGSNKTDVPTEERQTNEEQSPNDPINVVRDVEDNQSYAKVEIENELQADVAEAFVEEEFVSNREPQNELNDKISHKKKVILSLYGDETPSSGDMTGRKEENSLPEFKNDTTAKDVANPDQTVPETKTTVIVSNEKQTVVIGDVLMANDRTIGDSYASNETASDVASKISSSSISQIRTSIEINDKFLLIRDLFGGDADKYNDTITKLDSFENLDEVLLFIHENFNWNPDSEGANLLMDLIMKKFS